MKSFCRTVTLAASLGLLASSHAGTKPVNERHYATGLYALFIDNVFSGFIAGVEDPSLTADSPEGKIGANHLQRKHEGNSTYNSVRFRCGPGMGEHLTTWLSDGVFGKSDKHNVDIQSIDSQMKVVNHFQLKDCLLSEIEFPTFSADSKDRAYLNLELSPTEAREVAGNQESAANLIKSTKVWNATDFKLTFDGVDCSHVSSVNSLIFPLEFVDSTGASRQHIDPNGKYREPKIWFETPTKFETPFADWTKRYALSPGQLAKTGSLELTTSNHASVIFHLDFYKAYPIHVEHVVGKATDTDQKSKVEVAFTNAKLFFGAGE